MKKFSIEKEQILLDEAANPVDRANALACMRSDGVERHAHLVARLLDHPSPHLRADALRTLLTWDADEWLPLALERAIADEDEIVRNSLALDLGNAGRALPRHRDAILRVLVRLVECDPIDFVAAWAYSSIRFLLLPGGVVPSAPKDAFDRRRDVDWALLEPFRSIASS